MADNPQTLNANVANATSGPGTVFLEKVKFLQEHIKTVLSIATGSLVLSITLLHDLGPAIKGQVFLHNSWIWLFCSVMAGIACNYALTLHLNNESGRYRILVTVLSAGLHLCFAVAMAYFLFFAIANR